jgi:hypothetical protein
MVLPLLLVACTSNPTPTFGVSAVSPASGGYGDTLTVGVTAGSSATVLEVCGDAIDTAYLLWPYETGGMTYPARLTAEAPIRPTGVVCDVVAREGTETAAAGTFTFDRPAAAGRSLLLYANITEVLGARALFDGLVGDLVEDGVNVTRVASSADFVSALSLVGFDAVAWIDERQPNLTLEVVTAIGDHLADGGAALFTYWLLFDATSLGVPEARGLLGVSDATNVTPVADGVIDATLGGRLALGLDPASVTLVNEHFGVSYALRLVADVDATSSCTFDDVSGGSCGVVANGGRSLVTGFTVAPLIEGEGIERTRTILENALSMILFP